MASTAVGPVACRLPRGRLALSLATAVATALPTGAAAVPAARAVAIARVSCPSSSAARRMRAVARAARYRYSQERVGLAVHVAFRRVERDGTLVRALEAGDLHGAQSRADALLVGHVVRIRILSGKHVLIDANGGSFAVGGSLHQFRARGRSLGQMEVTIQDVVGYIKLVRKYDGADVVVRGSSGRVRSSLAVTPRGLPASGCVTVAGRRYAVVSFAETGFAHEHLTVSLLGPP